MLILLVPPEIRMLVASWRSTQWSAANSRHEDLKMQELKISSNRRFLVFEDEPRKGAKGTKKKPRAEDAEDAEV